MLSLVRRRLTLGAVSGGGDNPGGDVPEPNEVLYELTEAGSFDVLVPVNGEYELQACTSGAGAGYIYSFSPYYNGGGGASGCLLTAKLNMNAGTYRVAIPAGGKQGKENVDSGRGEAGQDLVVFLGDSEYLHMKPHSNGGASTSGSAASGGSYSNATLSVAPTFIGSSMKGNAGNGRNNNASNKYDGGASPVGNKANSGAGGYGDDGNSKVNSRNSRDGMAGYFKLTYLGENA